MGQNVNGYYFWAPSQYILPRPKSSKIGISSQISLKMANFEAMIRFAWMALKFGMHSLLSLRHYQGAELWPNFFLQKGAAGCSCNLVGWEAQTSRHLGIRNASKRRIVFYRVQVYHWRDGVSGCRQNASLKKANGKWFLN